MLTLLRNRWNELIVFAGCLLALMSKFVAAPPYGLDQDAWYKYGGFLVALLTGLWLVPVTIYRYRRHIWKWWSTAAVVTLVSTLVFLHYISLIDQWTIPYWRIQRIVVGEQLTRDAADYKKRLILNHEPTDDLYLLRQYGGNAALVWEEEEMRDRRRSLTSWYLGTVLLLASAAITVGQASYCTSSNVNRKVQADE